MLQKVEWVCDMGVYIHDVLVHVLIVVTSRFGWNEHVDSTSHGTDADYKSGALHSTASAMCCYLISALPFLFMLLALARCHHIPPQDWPVR